MGIDLLMTALAEERWLHIARCLIVVRVPHTILSNEYDLGHFREMGHGWLINHRADEGIN